MTVQSTTYGELSVNGPSGMIWADCPTLAIIESPAMGVHFFDEFQNLSKQVSASGALSSKSVQYDVYANQDVEIKQHQTALHQMHIDVMDGDNDQAYLQVHGPAFSFASGYRKLWFEARIKKQAVGDNGLAYFVGLAAPGLAADDTLIDDTGALASANFIGFHCVHADGDALNFVYRASGQTAQTAIASVSAIAADTFLKVGFVYDPAAPASQRIAAYVNNVKQGTFITATNIAAATFPSAGVFAPLIACKKGEATECDLGVDWIRCAQLLA